MIRAGDTTAAIDYFSRVIEVHPNDSMAYFDRGFLKENIGDLQGALADYTKQIEVDPSSVDSYFLIGLLKLRLKEYTNAIWNFNKVTDLEPDNVDAFFKRGYARLYTGEYGLAVADFSAAISMRPYDVEALSHRAWAEAQLKEFDQALADCDQAIQYDPKYVSTYYFKAWIRQQMKDEAATLYNLKIVYTMEPESQFVFPGAVPQQINAESIGKQLKKYNKEKRTNFAELYTRARVNEYLKNWAMAELNFTLALNVQPTCLNCLLNRAKTRLQLNQKDGACADVELFRKAGGTILPVELMNFCKD